MALTQQEKREWIKYILSPGAGILNRIGRVITPEYLESMGEKTDEEVRQLLADDRARKLAALALQKSKIDSQIEELGG